jgi:TolB-like protein/Tfp pilus assembly protein PilF/predicted Ser/Thr protein kinase
MSVVPQPGSTLGTYRIERSLGRGGMGIVFLAFDTRLQRHVALKVMDTLADTGTAHARLLREARNAAALNHPNICTIHEVSEAGGATFIAMEYVEGRSLHDRLSGGALPFEDAVGYGVQAADALAYAHDHGVIHRDFKAANAIATDRRHVKIVDFGLAHRGDAPMLDVTTMVSLVPAGVQAGTPYAMAPEQVRGEAADHRSDIWALGVLLYEMATGGRPFNAASTPELFTSILRDSPAPFPSHVPLELRVVIDRCLRKDASLRFQHAADVREALIAIQAGRSSPWAGWTYRVRRHPVAASAAAALLAAVAIGLALNPGGIRDRVAGRPSPAAPIRLAVLPFENLTGDPEQEYFSDGLTEEMITRLGGLQPQRLSVIARSSSMRYKHRGISIDQIGRELGVDYVVEGSTRREGNQVRISATLIQVRDQTQRWADTFERELAGVLSLQSDVARGIARSLSLTLLPAEEARLAGVQPVNPEAYEAYLKGRVYLNKLTRADIDTAQRYFEIALEKDPSYVMGYVGIATVWSGRQQMGFAPSSEAAPRMKAAIAKALELDSSLAEVRQRLAAAYVWTDWNWAAGDAEYRRGIELGPNLAEIRAFYSHFLYIMKRPSEAEAQIKRALELDPLNEQIQVLYGRDLVHARRFGEAVPQFQKVLKTNPDSPQALNNLAEVTYMLRRYDEAFTWEKTRWSARSDSQIADVLTRAYATSGYAGAMRQAADSLDARSRTRAVAAVDLAGMYVRAGLNDRAMDWLERAVETRDPMLPYINAHPLFDAVRRDPRFQALIKKLGLP